MCDKASILPGERICDDCRKKLTKTTTLQIPDSCSVSDSESQGSVASLSDELHQISKSETVVVMNDFLGKIAETSVTRRKLQSKTYGKKKVENISKVMKKAVISDTYSDQMSDEGEVVKQLKEKFSTADE